VLSGPRCRALSTLATPQGPLLQLRAWVPNQTRPAKALLTRWYNPFVDLIKERHYCDAKTLLNDLILIPATSSAYTPRWPPLSDRRLLKASGLPAKDVPTLAAAAAGRCQLPLTGNVTDFGHVVGTAVQGVRVVTPSILLAEIARR
jgi:hypothetical protein